MEAAGWVRFRRSDCPRVGPFHALSSRKVDQRQLEFPPPLARLFTIWFSPRPKEGTFMIKDAQVRQLRQFLGEGHALYRGASRCQTLFLVFRSLGEPTKGQQ